MLHDRISSIVGLLDAEFKDEAKFLNSYSEDALVLYQDARNRMKAVGLLLGSPPIENETIEEQYERILKAVQSK